MGDAPSIQFADALARAGEFTIEYLLLPSILPTAVQNVMTEQGINPHDLQSACVIGAALSYWDICVGNIEMTATRRRLGWFLPPLQTSRQWLVVPFSTSNPSFYERFSSVFLPFSEGLWMTLIAMILGFGLTLAWVEGGAEGGDFEAPEEGVARKDMAVFATISSYLAFLGAFAGPAHNPVTPGGRIVFLGFAWLQLIIASAYTANLASLLTVASTSSGAYADLAATFKADVNFCVFSFGPADVERWERSYPQLNGRLVGIDNRPEVVAQIALGERCQVGIASNEDLQLLHSENRYCEIDVAPKQDLPLRERIVAFPVTETWLEPLSVLTTELLDTDTFSNLLATNSPVDRCSTTSVASATLYPDDMTGTLIPSGVALILGVLVKLVLDNRAKKAATRADAAPPSVAFKVNESKFDVVALTTTASSPAAAAAASPPAANADGTLAAQMSSLIREELARIKSDNKAELSNLMRAELAQAKSDDAKLLGAIRTELAQTKSDDRAQVSSLIREVRVRVLPHALSCHCQLTHSAFIGIAVGRNSLKLARMTLRSRASYGKNWQGSLGPLPHPERNQPAPAPLFRRSCPELQRPAVACRRSRLRGRSNMRRLVR